MKSSSGRAIVSRASQCGQDDERRGELERGSRAVIPRRSTNARSLARGTNDRTSGERVMEFALSGMNLRAFTKSIAFLSRVGASVALDASDDGVKLSCVNASKSAYGEVVIDRSALEECDEGANARARMRCAALAKHIMAATRGRPPPARALVRMDLENDALIVRTSCERSGMTKTYSMSTLSDVEHVDADLDLETFGVRCALRAKTTHRLLTHFASAAQDDVTMTFEANVEGDGEGRVVTLSSGASAGQGLSQAMQTSVGLKRGDETILRYENVTGARVEVTVNLKDLRSVVHLCESSDVDVAIFCQQTGAPVVVKPTAEYKSFHGLGNTGEAPVINFHAMLVLSSMPPRDGATEAPSRSPVRERSRDAAPPRALANAPIGSQPWSAVADSEEATQRDIGVEVAAPVQRPWRGDADDSTVPNDVDPDDWLAANDDEYVEATPPEKRRKW